VAAANAVAAERGEDAAPTLRRRQVPLAVVMVALTTLTLWSLGQAIVVNVDEAVDAPAVAASAVAAPAVAGSSVALGR